MLKKQRNNLNDLKTVSYIFFFSSCWLVLSQPSVQHWTHWGCGRTTRDCVLLKCGKQKFSLAFAHTQSIPHSLFSPPQLYSFRQPTSDQRQSDLCGNRSPPPPVSGLSSPLSSCLASPHPPNAPHPNTRKPLPTPHPPPPLKQ